MKKMILSIVLAIVAFTLIGCQDTTSFLVGDGSVGNLSVTDNVITWNIIDGYDYLVLANGTLVTTEPVTSFDLTTLETGLIYNVTVQSYIDETLYDQSSFIYTEGYVVNETYDMYYPSNSEPDNWYDDLNITTYGSFLYIISESFNEIITPSEDDLSSNIQAFVSTLGLGDYTYYAVMKTGIIELDVHVYDVDVVGVISPDSVTVQVGEAAYFWANINGGTLDSMYYDENITLTENDYSFDGLKITINSNFISSVFNATPERESLVLMYSINNNDVSGYIVIYLIQS